MRNALTLWFRTLRSHRHPALQSTPINGSPWRCVGLGASLGTLLLTGCGLGLGGETEPEEAKLKSVSGFAGLAAADEPRAAVIGRDILGNNGNAADAAVAMGFAMSVTMPSRAGLGGGGACVIHKRREKAQEALAFLPKPGAEGGQVPGTPRGLAALHARYGNLPWSQVVAPAERLARFGAPVSRAFRSDLVAAANRLADADARSAFLGADGTPPEVGRELRRVALSGVLSGLRSQGAAYFYGGAFARRFAEGTEAAGRPITVEELRAYVPQYMEPLRLDFGAHNLVLPPIPVTGGQAAAQLWAMALEADAEDLDGGERAHLIAEAGLRTLSEQARWLTADGGGRRNPAQTIDDDHIENLLADYSADQRTPAARLSPPPRALASGERAPAAGLVTADRYGNMVACTFTMNGLFGAGRTAQGTGVLLAGDPGPGGGGLAMAPAVIGNPYTAYGYGALAATGSAAPSALVQVLLQLREDDRPLQRTLEAPRVAHAGQPDEVLVEPPLAADVRRALERRGHSLRPQEALGRVLAAFCPGGLPSSPGRCQAAADPRGHGLAQRAE